MSGVELKGLMGLKGINDLLTKHQSSDVSTGQLLHLPITALISGKYQPRLSFNDNALYELAESVKANGILQPLIVREVADRQYEIVVGERRWRAAKLAGLEKVPALIHNLTDETALAMALIENIQRDDLNPIEQAVGLKRLNDEFTFTHEEIARVIGRSRSAITNLLRLLSLPEEVQDLLKQGKLDMGHAKPLLTLEPSKQLMVAKQIIEKGLSVRDAERLVQKIKAEPQKASLDESNPSFMQKIESWNSALSEILSVPVQVKLNNDGKGRVVIPIESVEELEWLIRHLRKGA